MSGNQVEIDAEDEALAARCAADGRALMDLLEMTDCELSVVLTDDARIAELNAQWRGKEGPTDVLSFPQGAEVWQGVAVGDIVISLDTAARQAAEVGHELYDEVVVLLVHGLCHLLGHDHLEPAEATAMSAQEQALLRALGRVDGLVRRAAR